MTEARIVGCEQEGCPILSEGRCLEDFARGEGCPHVRVEEDANATTTQDEEIDRHADDQGIESESGMEQVSSTVQDGPSSKPDRVELGGDESLTVEAAELIAATHGAVVVLVAGEFRSGKTTLVAELYGQFLGGPYRDWSFAGAEALSALDRRYHGKRESSGLKSAESGRTEEEEMRLLDLRCRQGDRLLSLMFSDVRGEFFDNVIQGADVEQEVPLAKRSDRALVLLDGDKVADPRSRTSAVNHARQLIGGLTESGGLSPGVPLAITLSKADVVDEPDRAWFDTEAKELRKFARSRGCGDTEIFVTAARPTASPDEPEGLESVFLWLATDLKRPVDLPRGLEPRRSYLRLVAP